MSDPLDLDIDLNDVPTTMPRLATGDYHCKIKEAAPKPNSKGTGHNLEVTFATQDEGTSTDGDTIRAGYEIRKWYPLQQSDNPDAPSFKRDLRVLCNAAFGADDGEELPPLREILPRLLGADVVARVKFKEDPQYGPSNEIGFLRALNV